MSSRNMSQVIATVWTRRIADEFWSGPVTPLTFSLLAATMAARMVREPLEKAGLHALAAAPGFPRHASPVYVNAGLLAEVVALLPPALRSDGLLDLLPPAARRSLPATSWTATTMQVTSI